MQTHGIPNDMMPSMNQVACIIFGPLIQLVLYPFLHRRKIHFKPIARITVGFGFVALSMIYATAVQQVIYTTGPYYDFAVYAGKTSRPLPNNVNVWIQAPIYVFIAIGEIFAYVTALEYAYDHSPKNMKAIVQAISLLLAGVGSACAMGLTPISRDPYLVIFYASLASVMAATTTLFWWVFRKYDRLRASVDDEEFAVEPESDSGKDHTFTYRRGASALRLRPSPEPNRKLTNRVAMERDLENRVKSWTTVSTSEENVNAQRRNIMTTQRNSNGILIHKEWNVIRAPLKSDTTSQEVPPMMSGALPTKTPVGSDDERFEHPCRALQIPHRSAGSSSHVGFTPGTLKHDDAFKMESDDASMKYSQSSYRDPSPNHSEDAGWNETI